MRSAIVRRAVKLLEISTLKDMSDKHQRQLSKRAAEGGLTGRIAFDYHFLYSNAPNVIKSDDRYKSDYEAATKARENARKTLDFTVRKFESSILLSYVSTSVIFFVCFPLIYQ